MSGSHMDSQPTGGRFDGMYGVLAAFEALEALEDAGVKTKRPGRWPSPGPTRKARASSPAPWARRCSPATTGSTTCWQVKDWKGVVLKDALAETLKAAPAPMREGKPGFALDCYVEAHIEQGPRLENEQQDDRRRHRHPGQPPLHRRDARARRRMPARRRAPPARTPSPRRLRIAAAMYEATTDADDTLRFTIGRVDVSPGSPNTVPGKAIFTIDMRHPDDAVLEAHEAKLRGDRCRQGARPARPGSSA